MRHKAEFLDSQGDKNLNGLPREMSGSLSVECFKKKEKDSACLRRRVTASQKAQGGQCDPRSPSRPIASVLSSCPLRDEEG